MNYVFNFDEMILSEIFEAIDAYNAHLRTVGSNANLLRFMNIAQRVCYTKLIQVTGLEAIKYTNTALEQFETFREKIKLIK